MSFDTAPGRRRRVAALVVTYQRLSYLKRCVDRLRSQTYGADILVVDNESMDGTGTWLSEQEDVVYIRQRNLGGAGGFHTGLKAAYALGYDYVWCMDDDTMPEPTCLKELIHAIDEQGPDVAIGWICSKVNWVDGSPAPNNQPIFVPEGSQPSGTCDAQSLPALSCSFVSVCVSRSAIAAVGLPRRDLFIYLDDVEYTRRITGAGFGGHFAPRSVAVHETPTNDPWPGDLRWATRWKSRYYFRNTATLCRTISRGSPRVFVHEFARRAWWATRSLATTRRTRWIGYAWAWLLFGLFLRSRVDDADAPWADVLRDIIE